MLKKEKEEAQQQKFLNLKQLHINLSFIEALTQMPKYAKFSKGLLTNKARLEEAYIVTMNERCSTILLNKFPSKEKDPGSFTIPCDIGHNALADLGASISLMIYTMYEKLGLGEPNPTRMSFELADSEIPIRRIDSVNTSYSEAQKIAGTDGVNSKHMYSASTNEIDEKKPELKDLPNHLEYAYLQGNKFVILHAQDLMEDGFKPVIRPQRHLNTKIQDVVKSEIVKLLDFGLTYPISDSSWVSPIHVFPNKGGMTIVLNDNNQLIPSRIVTRWRVCIDYRKLNDATRKDHFPLPFIDQISRKDNVHLSLWNLFLQRNAVWIMQRTCDFLKMYDGNFPRHSGRLYGSIHGLFLGQKGAENLAVDYLLRLENLDLEVFTEQEIVDEFPDEHLMMLKVKPNDDEPWLCSDNIMRRCIAGSEILEILTHCHSGPIGDTIVPRLLKERSGNISSRSEMHQNNIQKLLEDLQIIKKELTECDRPIFFDDNKVHSKNFYNEIAASNSNQEKEKPPQDFDIRQLIREECCIEVCDEQKQNMENTILELVEICRQKELYYMHDNVDDLIESALNFKLLSINSQRLNKEKQEDKNVVEQPAKRRTRIEKSLQNFRVIHKSSISLNNTSQISSVYAVAPILSTKEPKYSPSMGYEHPNTTLETESDEIIKSGVEELVPILSENEVTLEDKRECDMPVCENSPICDDHSEIFSDSNNDDDISSDEDAFEDIEYVEASLPDLEIVSLEEENDVHQEEEEFDLEEIQDVVLREKLLSINHLIANIESLNDNPTPDCVLNSSALIPTFEESDNSLSDNFSPEFKTFCDHTKETRSGSTTTHANDSLPEYDSFCFKIKPDQERLINVVKNDISDDSTNDPLLEEADLFLASDNLIPQGIENFAYDSEGDIRFLEELLIDDSIPINESRGSNFDNPSFPRPPSKPPDADFDFDAREEISVVINTIDELECLDPRDEFDVSNDENDDYFPFIFFIRIFLPYLICSKLFLSFLSAESEDTIFDPGISV
uniref:Reverse transcriptase domain-containing protein n=1 Tax=Tanacetum cinerariifolium TaxID=118510 RepID=A0A6L2KKU1_TANCI|nr:hypothetical protein [Tanacetum cinerariifolium]